MAQNFKGDIKVQGTLVLPNATPGKALQVDGSGNLTQSTTSTTQLGYLDGVTSDIQTQINSKAADSVVIKKDGSVAYTGDQPMGGNKITGLGAPSANGDALRYDQLGANNGIATLDAGGKVPVSQLPNSVMEFKGVFDPATATFTDASGNAGDVYLATAAGSYDAGSGSITYAIGDWAVHNGSIFQKSLNSNSVVSVNSQQGVVVLDSDDISEGATNLYHTDERAQDAVGTILVDSSTIDLTYNDGTPSITADIISQSIDNTHISLSANIDLSKLAATTASRAIISDGSGVLSPSSVTSIELGYVSGVTSAIQTQLDNKLTVGGSQELIADLNAAGQNISDLNTILDGTAVIVLDAVNRALVNTAGDTVLDFSGANLNASSVKIVNLADPTSAQDAATKNYVDSVISTPPVGDIAPTSYTYAGSVGSPTDVTGLVFANASVRSFKAQVSVTNATSALYEVFELTGIQKGASWVMDQVSTGDNSTVVFTITNAGQIQFTNSDSNGGVMKFRAQALPV